MMRAPPSSTNWIIATGQVWKAYVALAGFVGAIVFFTMAFYFLGSDNTGFIALTACGIFLGLTTFTWFSTTLCCPHCLAKLAWTMIAIRPHSSWLIDLATLEQCPVCGRTLASASKP